MSINNPDSLFFNNDNKNNDRILFFDGSFVRLTRELDSVFYDGKFIKDSLTTMHFGQYKIIGDTIYFSKPDSSRNTRYYCFCTGKFDKKKDYRFYGHKKQILGTYDLTNIFSIMFNRPKPNSNEMVIVGEYKATITKNEIHFFENGGNIIFRQVYKKSNLRKH